MAGPGQVAMSGLGLKNQVAVSDGTVGAPSVSFSNDTNTGLYRPGADVVGVVTGGIERMRVDAVGNVGIGTGTPVNQLDLGTLAANDGLRLEPPSGANSIFVGRSLQNALVYKWDFGQLLNSTANICINIDSDGGDNNNRFIRVARDTATDTGGTEIMRITEAGNVGIGSTSPQTVLDVAGNIRLTGVFIQPNKPILRVNFTENTFGDLNSTGVIKWNNVEIDTRSGYSTSTGLYTIPVTGYYHFYCHAYRTSTDSDTEICFIINGNSSAQVTGNAYSRANTPSTTGFIPLVLLTDIYLAQGNTIGVIIAIPSVHYNSQGISYFGGHMI